MVFGGKTAEAVIARGKADLNGHVAAQTSDPTALRAATVAFVRAPELESDRLRSFHWIWMNWASLCTPLLGRAESS